MTCINNLQTNSELNTTTTTKTAGNSSNVFTQLGSRQVTSLPTTDFSHISDMMEKNLLPIQQMGSQGLVVSLDQSCAYSHESTYEPSHRSGHGFPHFINQDRGGFFTLPDGTNGGCICDGMGGEGGFSTFWSQMVATYMIDQFSTKNFKFSTDKQTHEYQARQLFTNCLVSLNKDLLQYKQLPFNGRGGTTVALAKCTALPPENGIKQFLVQTGAVGDSAIFHLCMESKKSTLLNPISRSETQATYGITRELLHTNQISTHSKQISERDIVILTTDGFTDNVCAGKFSQVIQLVAFSTFFDQPMEALLKIPRPWETRYSRLPELLELQAFMCTEQNVACKTPSPAQITQRLTTYVKVVTWYIRSLFETQARTGTAKFPPESRYEQKTDDCMIIAFKPSSLSQ